MKKRITLTVVILIATMSAFAQIKGTNPGKDISNAHKKFPVAYCMPVACGYGFTMNIFSLGTNQPMPPSNTYPYQIYFNGTMVDAGTVSNGDNTNWVLQPCTNYEIYFFGWGFITPQPTEIIQVTSDGCGNVFVC